MIALAGRTLRSPGSRYMIDSTDGYSQSYFGSRGMKLLPSDQLLGRCNEIIQLPLPWKFEDHFLLDVLGNPSIRLSVEEVLSYCEDRACLQVAALPRFLERMVFSIRPDYFPAVMVFLGSIARDEYGIRHVPVIHFPSELDHPIGNLLAIDMEEGWPGFFQETVLVVMKK